MKTGKGFLDRLIERMDRLDPSSLQTYILRLAREKGFLETVFDTIREGIIVIDEDRRIRFINSAAHQLLGIRDEGTGQRIGKYLKDIDWAHLLRADPHQWHRLSRQEIEVFYPVHRHLSFYLVPVEDEGSTDSNIPTAVIILQDVTQAHEAAAKDIESKRVQAITMLAAGVAHELGNPLNSLNIHLQLLARAIERIDTAEVAEETRDLVGVARDEVRRLDSIVSNFLHAIRPVPLEMKPAAVGTLLREALDFMRPEIENDNILVQLSMPEVVPQLMADADQLKQAFYNIIKNAVQAMPEGGVLRVGCAVRDDFIDVRFADTGRGIPQEDLSRILDPYFSTRPEGTGLGLLIVERIVKSHGGELGIDTYEGEGSTFTITLPRRNRQMRLLQAPDQIIETDVSSADGPAPAPPADAARTATHTP